MSTKRMNTPFRQTAPSKNCWELTEDRMERLEALGAEGVPLTVAARELGASPRTIQNAADKDFKADWLRQHFPRRQGFGSAKGRTGKETKSKLEGEIRRLKVEDVDFAALPALKTPQTKWLTKGWRVAA